MVKAEWTATGAGATACVAQSTGGTGSAPTIVYIGAVNVVCGKGGHALSLLGGADNMIVNAGTLVTLDDLDGMVTYAEGGNKSITKSGLIVCSIDLSSSNNRFTNSDAAIFLLGPAVGSEQRA